MHASDVKSHRAESAHAQRTIQGGANAQPAMDANQKPQAAFEMTPVDLESDSSSLPASPPQAKKKTTTLPTRDDELQRHGQSRVQPEAKRVPDDT